MWWRRSKTEARDGRATILVFAFLCLLMAPGSAAAPGLPRRIRALDADNHNVLINRPGVVTILIGTSQGSQKAARAAGVEMYPFQGRPDFQLMVAVDLRNSLADWAPSIAISQMRKSLDGEAVELKPYFLKNGNRSNPRVFSHVIPDFKGTLFPQLGWPDTSDDLRAIVFGSDGREYMRFDKVDNMDVLYNAVRSAIVAGIELKKAHAAAAPPIPVTRSTALGPAGPPLPPEKPATQ